VNFARVAEISGISKLGICISSCMPCISCICSASIVVRDTEKGNQDI
jgi:hypothetical protein